MARSLCRNIQVLAGTEQKFTKYALKTNSNINIKSRMWAKTGSSVIVL